MKKRLLSALLALALVFVLLPTTALAKVVSDYFDCDISILGNYWKFEKDSNNEYLPVYYKSEASSFEDSTVAPENNYLEIRKTGEKEITITVHGDVNITATGIYIDTIAASKSVIINGDGHLTVKYTWTKSGQNYSAIDVSTLTVEGVALSAEASMGPALFATYGIHIKDGAMVEAKSGYFEAVCEGTTNKPGGITVDNATLVATATGGGNRSAIKTYGDIAFTNAKVTATNKSSENAAIQAKTYEGKLNYLYVSGTSTITATNQSTSTDTMARAIGATIKNNNTSEKIEVGSSKVDAGKTWYTNAKQVTITSPALEKDSYVYIAGENAVVGQWTNIPAAATGTGSYYYDADKKELTLKDVNIASSSIINGIQFTKEGTYTINLVGTNTMSGFSTGISANSADQYVSNINITITGAGSLEVSTTSYAIAMNKGNLKFENTGEIKLTTSNPSKNRNVLSVSGNITITDMDKYSVTGITQTGSPNVNGDTVTLSKASHLKGYQNPDDTWTYLKSITIASKPSETYYNDKAMKYGETRIAGSGTISCDENGVITLNGATEGTLEFRSSADSTLVLEGTSTLSSIVTTQKGLTISGSGSLTVGSIRVTNNDNISADLTITGGATVIAGTATSDAKAIDITGNLTVNSGATLTATNTSETKPTIDVTGNVTISGDPGTNAYTVSAHNSYNVQKDRVGNLSPSGVPSAIKIGGTLNISAGARVMAQTDSYGAGVMLSQNSTITVEDAFLSAKNSSCDFAAISFSGQTGKIDVSGAKGEVVAENTHAKTNLVYRAINAFVYNSNTDFYLKMQSEGVINEAVNKIIAPGGHNASGGKKVTITRGDEVVRTPSPVDIDGHTLLNDTYYTITNGSTVAEGSENNYNAFYDSVKKTLKLNNAKISTTTNNAAIKIGEDAFATYTITVTGTNELQGNYNHCIESYSSFKINGDGTLEMTNGSNTTASVIYCGPDKSLTIGAEVIFKNNSNSGVLLGMVEKDAYSFAEGYNVYASTNVSGSPLEAYDAAKGSTYKYLRVTKENLAPTTPTTYTVTITTGDNMSRESGTLIQEVTKGAAITEVKFIAASGHYFPADYVSKMNLPAGLTAEIRENSWYLIISGTPTSDVTINLPAASVRPTITVSMPTPVAGNTPATANDITLTYSDINKSVSKKLSISNVVWWSYVSNGDGSITPGNTLSSGDKFVEGTEYYVTIDFEGVSENYAIVPAADTTAWRNAEWGSRTMTLYFNVTGAPCNHEYTNDWYANGNTHWHECKLCRAHADEVAHTFGDWITDTPATDTTDGSKHRTCSVCQYQENATIPKTGTGEIVPPTPDNPGTIVIIRPAEEEKPAQQPNPSTGANDLVGLAVAAAVAAALGSAALLRKHD